MNSVAMKKDELPQEKNLLLIDGYGFVFRAYHAMAKTRMTRADGTPTGAVFAFTNMLVKMLSDHPTDYIAVVFDAGKNTFRNELYSEYKANRPPAPDDLIPQFPILREAVQALNIAIIEKEGFEADDLIATYAKIAREHGNKVLIVSSDKDLMQLVGDGVQMYDPLKSKFIGVAEVVEKFGVKPDKVIDILSLMGDSSDNIPGVPGIGPKTAAELINQFGSLDEVMVRLDEIKQDKRRQSLKDNSDKAFLSRDLVRLCETAPVEYSFDDLLVKHVDKDKLLNFLNQQNFKSLIGRIGKLIGDGHSDLLETVHVAKPASTNNNFILIEDIKKLSQYIEIQKEISAISFSVELDKKGKLFGISMSLKANEACYVALNSESSPKQTNLFGDAETKEDEKGLTLNSFIFALKSILQDSSILKIGHDLKELVKSARASGVEISPLEDIMLMSYSLDAGLHSHELDKLILRHYSEGVDNLFSEDDISTLPPEKAKHFSCTKAIAISHIYQLLNQRLFTEKQVTSYERMEKPLLGVLADMELRGIKISPTRLKELSDYFSVKIQELEKEIFAEATCEFNIGSPKQLGEVLFDKMGIQGGKKSKKTGAYSTDVQVLQDLADSGHSICSKILEWRHFSKIKSTYTDTLPLQIKSDGRIHTTFAMAATNTGRLSSHNPNIQNIPIRSEEGNKIREAFIAEKGCKLLSADYSQIELRLLAHIADIDTLKHAFKNNLDIHAATASQMFGVDIVNVSSELRRRAKTINFGIIYGISAFGLAQRLGIERKEASEYITQYFKQYPGIEAYMTKTVEFARQHGYVNTIWGRKCYITGINDRNQGIRQFSERAAINAPLQGSAADIIKKAMIVLDKKIRENGLKARLLLQVHDELVVEAPENEVEKVASLMKQAMENVINLSVPITVDVGVGDNWREIH